MIDFKLNTSYICTPWWKVSYTANNKKFRYVAGALRRVKWNREEIDAPVVIYVIYDSHNTFVYDGWDLLFPEYILHLNNVYTYIEEVPIIQVHTRKTNPIVMTPTQDIIDYYIYAKTNGASKHNREEWMMWLDTIVYA